jgi:hypothetical protein
MPEKLDLFELSVKRGLENYEAPMESGAWEQFQAHRTGGAGSSSAAKGGASFLGKFGVAAAILSAVGIFINYGTETDQLAHHSEPIEVVEPVSAHHGTAHTEASEYVVENASTESSEKVLAENAASEEGGTGTEVIEASQETRITTINKKLQQAADRVENEEVELEKKTTTRYVGKNFNLGALSEFSPNGDGKDDSFLPATLSAADHFTMTISDDKGARLFRSNSIDRPWTGLDSAGKSLIEGHYSWEVILHKDNNNKEIFRGVVKLER